MPGWGRMVLHSQDGFWSVKSRQRREQVLRPKHGFQLCEDTWEMSEHQGYPSTWEEISNLALARVPELRVWIRRCVHSGYLKDSTFFGILLFFFYRPLSPPGSCCYLNFLPPTVAPHAFLWEIRCCCRQWGGSGRRQQWLEGLSPAPACRRQQQHCGSSFIASRGGISLFKCHSYLNSYPMSSREETRWKCPICQIWLQVDSRTTLGRTRGLTSFTPEIQGISGQTPHCLAQSEVLQKLPAHFIPSCVSSVDGIREVSPSVSFSLQG